MVGVVGVRCWFGKANVDAKANAFSHNLPALQAPVIDSFATFFQGAVASTMERSWPGTPKHLPHRE